MAADNYGFPNVAPLPNQNRNTRSLGGEPVPTMIDVMERATPQRNESPMSALTPYRRRARFDGV